MTKTNLHKMKKIIYSAVIILFFGVISCSEDFTDNPREDVQDLDAFFLDEANVEQAVIGIYDLMQLSYGRDWHSAFLVKLLPGDDANCAGGNKDDQSQLQEIDDFNNVSSSNPSIQSVWDTMYRTIAMSNLVVESLLDSSLSNKDRATAEAKFFRAWCYFELTTMFGDIPLRLSLPKGAEDFAQPKSTKADIYLKIKEDLDAAIAGLPDKSAVAGSFRVSKGAAQALMGKVLVFEGNYSQAVPFFEAVINNPAHDLEANPADVWAVSKEFGQESLFELGYITTSGLNWNAGSVAWGGNNESNLHIQLMGPRGGIFNLGSLPVINGWGFNLPTKKLVDAFEAEGDVDRKGATLLTEAELLASGGSIDLSQATGGSIWDYEGAIRMKYATRPEETSPDGVRELNYGTNFRLFRYAEVLLLAAEAYNRSSDDAGARRELNKIRQRAGLADVSTSLAGDALFDAIVNEKFLELAHEGQRFWDLVRWGRAATELSGTMYSATNNLFPIPISEIDKNTALTPEDQNPGY